MGSYQNSAPQSNFTGDSQKLLPSARLFAAIWWHFQAGIPVFPLIGGENQQSGKRPAIRWRRFQRLNPTPQDLARWFLEDGHNAYGVVCGEAAGLVVLDLDDAATAARLAAQFPALMQTRVVRSGRRGTPHVYWRVDYPVQSRQLAGADLKGEGGYVVGPGSVIGGQVWELVNDAPIRPIARRDLDRVLAALGSAPAARLHTDATLATPGAGDTLAAQYQRLVAATGQRNNSLFATACRARDAGYSPEQATAILTPLHATTAPRGHHPAEAPAQRRREATRTINSAYSRPPCQRRPVEPPAEATTTPLPNSAREALLQRGDGVAVLRTLEGLYLRGIQPGTRLNEQQACQLLKGLVGRYSIRKAFAATGEDGTPLFPAKPSPHPTLADADASCSHTESRQKTALSPGSKRIQARKGRPTHWYTIPTVTALCKLLGVKSSSGDPIQAEDLKSRKTYRQALEREFIRRRPGQYFQAVLAARLGVSTRTIRRYHQEIPIHTLPQYVTMPVFWFNLRQIPAEDEIKRYHLDTGGQFLQDDTGKRWPLKREIAHKLLKAGRRVYHRRQTANFYYYGETPPPAAEAVRALDAAAYTCTAPAAERPLPPESALARGKPWRAPPLPPAIVPPAPAPSAPSSSAAPGASRSQLPLLPDSPPKPSTRSQRRRYRDPLAEPRSEWLAGQVQDAAADLSLVNARQLVDVFGPEAVGAALDRVRWLARQGKLRSPAGFMVTAARTAWRARHEGLPTPHFVSLPPRRSHQETPVEAAQDATWRAPAYQNWRTEFFGWDGDPLAGATQDEALPY